MIIITKLRIFRQKKLLTRNRFRNIRFIVTTRLLSIFTMWNANLLLIQIKFTVII